MTDKKEHKMTIAEEMDALDGLTFEQEMDGVGFTKRLAAQEMFDMFMDPKTPSSVRVNIYKERAAAGGWNAPEQHEYRFRPGEIEGIMDKVDQDAAEARGGAQGDDDV